MIITRFLIFALACFCVNVCYAKRLVTYDSLAMDTAMEEITKLGSESSYKTVEEAANDLYKACELLADRDVIDIDKVMDKCEEIVKNTKTCAKFINTYSTYLDHVSYCKRANKFKAGNFSFNECREYVMDNDMSYSKRDTTGRVYDQCRSWIESAQKCRFYLIGYYVDKSYEVNEKDKKYYECILDKLQEGDMDFPISKMERACK